MNPQPCSRLLWQLPALLGIVFLVMPDLAWHSALFGPWPLWLLAAPATYAALNRRRSAKVASPNHALSGAYILDFPVPAKFSRAAQGTQRRAA